MCRFGWHTGIQGSRPNDGTLNHPLAFIGVGIIRTFILRAAIGQYANCIRPIAGAAHSSVIIAIVLVHSSLTPVPDCPGFLALYFDYTTLPVV